jgi:hypothetical protein
MGEWNRGDRAPGDYGERRTAPRDEREPRSFDFERDWVDPEHGGYTGESFGGPDFAPQVPGGRDLRGQPYPRPGWRDEAARAGFDRYGVRGDKDYRGDVDRARDEGRGPEPAEDYRSEAYRSEGYGREAGVIGRNPALDRIVEDPSGRGWREDVGRHRGRGPRNWVRSDTRIHEDVSEALSDDPSLDASDIEVAVRDGEVTLSGAVRSRADRARAEELAWRPGGVKQVQNDLRVQPAGDAGIAADARGRPG